jgi:hypothetical protein
MYILNRLSSNGNPYRCPSYERVYGEKPDISRISLFGSTCYRRLPDSQKQDLKGHECKLLGIDEERKESYLVYDLLDQKVCTSRDLTFPSELYISGDGPNIEMSNKKQFFYLKHQVFNSKIQDFKSTDPSIETTKLRRSKRHSIKTKRLIEEVNIILCNQFDEPTNFREVWFSTYLNEWIKAMNKELQALNENGTWKRVKRSMNKNIISCRWVYKLKRNDDGSIQIFKARLVARGFTQVYDEDFNDTYSPVASKSTLRIFLVISKSSTYPYINTTYHQLMLKLNGEELYLELPNGFKGKPNDFGNLTTSLDDPNTGQDSTEVFRLIKGLYGLKQSGLYWNCSKTRLLLQLTQLEAVEEA